MSDIDGLVFHVILFIVKIADLNKLSNLIITDLNDGFQKKLLRGLQHEKNLKKLKKAKNKTLLLLKLS